MNQISIATINSFAENHIINLSAAASIEDVGKATFSKLFRIIRIYLHTIRTIVKVKPELVYFTLCPTGPAFLRDFMFILALKIMNLKIVYHIHGRGIANASRLLTPLYWFTFRNTTVIHLSSVFWPEVSSYIKKSNFYVLPNCTPSTELILRKQKRDLNESKIHFLYLSNYVRGKGPMDVIYAAKALYEKKANCKFTLAGGWRDSSLKSEIDDWIRENQDIVSAGFIEIKSEVYNEEKLSLLAACDCLVFPSKIDTFPLILIEAQEAGLAIISTDSGAIPEILSDGEAGIICPAGDLDALINKIETLILNRKLLGQLKNHARRNFLEKFTRNSYEEKLQHILTEIIK